MFTIRKIHFTLICFTIICTTIQAQTNRNTWMAGGNFDLIAGLGDARPISQFQLQTNVGYFPLKGLSIGATTLFQRIKYTTNGTTISTGFGPFLRYYISTPAKIISLTLVPNISLAQQEIILKEMFSMKLNQGYSVRG